MLLVLATITTGISFAQSADPARSLALAKHSIMTLREQAVAGTITSAQADAGTQSYLKKASSEVGHQVSIDEVMAAPDVTLVAQQELTPLQQFAGLISLTSILLVVGGIVGVVCVCVLFGSFITDLLLLLKNIPIVVYEAIAYLTSVAVTAAAWMIGPPIGEFVALVGCLLFMAALAFTMETHKEKLKGWKVYGTRYSLILFVVWTAVALLFNSELIGFFAVGALMSALGFSIMVDPLCYSFGFKEEAVIGRATMASFLILAGFVGIRIAGKSLPYLQIFDLGALFLGGFVGFLGLLITSSKWYEAKRDYAVFQLISILAAIAAVVIGTIFGIQELQKIGGTFFVFYVVEKVMEVPAESVRGYATLGLVGSGMLFGLGWFVRTNPELLRPFLFLPS